MMLPMQLLSNNGSHNLDPVQRFATIMMAMLVLLTFVGTNMQALLWQSSDWLVSTVLPAVVIDLTNDERANESQSQLVRNSVLDQAAQAKAQHMADNEYFAHYAPDGTTPWSFFSEAEYVYAHAGENLAIHFTDSSEVVEAWMQSPSHRKNIVDSKFSEIGVGTARGEFDGYDTVYVVQLFGTPAAVAPEIVAEEPKITPLEVETPQVVPEPVLAQVPDPVLPDPANEVIAVSPDPVVLAVVEPEPELELVPPAKTFPQDDLVVETAVTNDILVIETELATSSGLAVATIQESSTTHAGATMASIATRPHLVLQIMYGIVSILIVASLLYALVAEARRLHYVQVAYSLLLFVVMGGLWFLHSSLTNGAVIM